VMVPKHSEGTVTQARSAGSSGMRSMAEVA
jgi:hypothetical protein